MRKIAIFFMILSLFGDDSKEILNLINILKNKKFEYSEIVTIYNPFKKEKAVLKEKFKKLAVVETNSKIERDYNLEIIFQNRVRIDNSWYKNGDKLDNYTIILKNQKVYLKDKNRTIELKRKTLIKVIQ